MLARYRQRRVISKPYRDEVHLWARTRWREHFQRLGAGLALFAAFAGPLGYWAWARWRDVRVDLGVLLLVAAGPYLLWLAAAWVSYRVQAPAQVCLRYKQFYDDRNPPLPWATAVLFAKDGSGVTVQVFTADGHAAVHADLVTFELPLQGYRSPCTRTFSDIDISQAQPIEVVYPDDFDRAAWPLSRMRYEFQLHIEATAAGASVRQGIEMNIK